MIAASGCGGAASAGSNGRIEVVAGFYPLAYAAEEVAGNRRRRHKSDAGRRGAPRPRADAARRRADSLRRPRPLSGGGFQPALEEAVEGADGRAVDVLYGLDLRERGRRKRTPTSGSTRAVRSGRGADRRGAGRRGPCPAARLSAARPRRGVSRRPRRLRPARARDRHDAFGYLADRYGLEVIPIAGLAPEVEPTPRDLEEIAELVEDRGVTTVFVEPLRLAGDRRDRRARGGRRDRRAQPARGADGGRELARGEDYLSVMRANLAALREGARMPVTPAVELRGRRPSRTGRGQPVLADVDLPSPQGEFVAIAGPNGGGKTTLIRIVLGLERPGDRVGAPLRRARRTASPPRDRSGTSPQRAQLGVEAPVTVREVVSAGRLAPGGLLGPSARRATGRSSTRRSRDVGLARACTTPGCPSSRAASSSAPSSRRRSPAEPLAARPRRADRRRRRRSSQESLAGCSTACTSELGT